MGHQQPGQETPELSVEQEPLPPFITDCYRNAIERLTMAFAESRPLAILIGDGKCGADFVLSRFLDRLDDDVVVARINDPSSNAIELMRDIVSAIGFDPKDVTLTDLEQIFEMFLLFQQTHNRRTIICVEETQDHGQWVLDRIRRLVESETKAKFGLMVILSGRPELKEVLEKPPLNSACARAGKRISLAPFSIAETKEYLRRRVEGTRAAGIDQVFTFNAVIAIQELSFGIPDEVSNLCSKCLELADMEGTAPATTALVQRAAKLLRLASIVEEPPFAVDEITPIDKSPSKGQLIAYVNDLLEGEHSLDGGHVLIGRDRSSDLWHERDLRERAPDQATYASEQ
jgi:general secretion pathway protein A